MKSNISQVALFRKIQLLVLTILFTSISAQIRAESQVILSYLYLHNQPVQEETYLGIFLEKDIGPPTTSPSKVCKTKSVQNSKVCKTNLHSARIVQLRTQAHGKRKYILRFESIYSFVNIGLSPSGLTQSQQKII